MNRSWKNPVSLLLVLVFLIALLPSGASASEIAGGYCGANGTNLSWSLDSSGTLTITGSGAMADFSSSNTAWYGWENSISSVSIGNGVTNIGVSRFFNCSRLTTVIIPDSVTSIGDEAFAGCSNLILTIPASVNYIGAAAFYNCNALTSVTIPSSVTYIGNDAFGDCKNLTEIIVENNNYYTTENGVLFNKEKTNLKQYPAGKSGSYSIPSSVSTISDWAFMGCRGLTSISIPETVTIIGDYTFGGCSSLTSVNIPDSVIYINDNAFDHCTGLINVTFGNSVRTLCDNAFRGCIGLTNVTIPASVTHIGELAFYGCSCLTQINIDSGNQDYCSSIDGVLFNKEKTTLVRYPEGKMGTYAIPASVNTIGNYAFSRCEELTSLTIPATIFSVGDYAFSNSSLTEVYYGGTQAEWDEIEFGDGNKPLTAATIHYSSRTITFDPNGGTVTPSSKRVTNGGTYGELPVPMRSDYSFDGWYTSATGGTQVTASTVVSLTIDQTLYAHWTRNLTVPEVTTNEAMGITKNSATFSAVVEDDGGDGDLSRQFVYWDKYDTASKYTVTADANFTATVGNLSPGTEYYFYARATNSAGTGTGSVLSFRTTSEDKPQSVTVSPSYLSLQAGDSYQLLASVLPATASNRSIVWSSSDTSIVKVDQTGTVTAVREGSAVVYATTEVNRLKASCTVQVSAGTINGTFDFSEWNMATNTSDYAVDGFDSDTATDGGSYTMATAYLARWDGAVLESSDPYRSYNGNPRLYYQETDADYHVQEVIWLPGRESASDNDEIKAAIMNYGAIYGAFLVNWNYFDSSHMNYYFPASGSSYSGGHAIAVVGWDDDYPASNFKVTPPGNGAFICKNSWGTGSGEGGYFYISYYDKWFGKDGCAAVPSIERNTNYNTIYQYDPLGACSAINTTYAANVFPPSGSALPQNELLRAVSFYTYSKNTSYEVYVVEDYQNSASLQQKGDPVAAGVIRDMGYHTVKLDSEIELQAGTRFAVIVKLTVSSGSSCVYIEFPATYSDGTPYSIKARANSDESYYSPTGAAWYDLTSKVTNANFCIKAFTDNGTAMRSGRLYSAIDNEDRAYESDRVYTLEEALAAGLSFNEEFINWHPTENEDVTLMGSSESEPLGDIPAIVDMGTNTVSYTEGDMFPARYDLRAQGCVTEVRDQGHWGTCWAHAMYASLESCLLKRAKSAAPGSGQSAAGDEDYLALIGQYGISATRLELSDEIAVMAVGSTFRLDAAYKPDNTTESAILWSSSNDGVATVDTNGLVTAHAAGTARITAASTDGQLTASCSVTVCEGAPVSSVSLLSETVTKAVGDVFLTDYVINPAEASNQAVTWTSSDPEIVSVNAYGRMEAKSVGTAMITVTTVDGGYTDTMMVHVNDGMDYGVTELSSQLTRYDQNLFGSIELQLENRTGEAGNVTVVIGVYSLQGRMLTSFHQTVTTAPGSSRLSFNNLVVSNVQESAFLLKCFVLNGSTLAPVSGYTEARIET